MAYFLSYREAEFRRFESKKVIKKGWDLIRVDKTRKGNGSGDSGQSMQYTRLKISE